jgi:hypothetical protein
MWLLLGRHQGRESPLHPTNGERREITGFYAWQGRPESARSKHDRQLKLLVHASFAASKGRYGSPRIHRAVSSVTLTSAPPFTCSVR